MKTFGLSQILCLSSVYKVPKWAITEIEFIMSDFLWNGKQQKVKAKVIIQQIKHGGYNMCDMTSMFKCQSLKWVKKYFNNSNSMWKYTIKSIFSKLNVDLLLKSNFDLKIIPQHSEFYKEMLIVLKSVRHKENDTHTVFNEIIWYNENLKINNKTIFYKKIWEAGFEYICDLFNEDGNVISYVNLSIENKRSINSLQWNGLNNAIPRSWKTEIKQNIQELEIVHISVPVSIAGKINDYLKLDPKIIYNEEIYKKKEYSKGNIDYTEQYNIIQEEWEFYYQLGHKLKLKNKVKEFQFKILHKYLPTNRLLYLMNKIDSDRCTFCFLYSQTILHLFCQCLPVRSLWFALQNKIKMTLGIDTDFSEKTIIFGMFKKSNLDMYDKINKIIVYVKYYIFRSNISKIELCFDSLMSYLEHECNVQFF